ncbi:hypothetical protein SKUL_19 [Pseudomonas phage Skulduggery]|uniref:Uncharacterized protein n=1 Tax=Pseudomonas phage Skulduggery TaxID=2006671 RepID=A0A1Y0T0U2_9CAUD|nr:hypothetical protein PP627_gp19 [Pseudomonas phage Skulduggery]ARV77118.1 hypothetical protein SKUL_19 [Pseudomonas phage Skulduggery]
MTEKFSEFKAGTALTGTEQVVGLQAGENTRFPLSLLVGKDGREVEMRHGANDIEWRLTGETAWKPLASFVELTGPQGAKVLMRRTATHLQYSHEGSGTWDNIIALSELKGDPGAGLNPKGAWVAATYQPGDYVTFGTSVWILRDSAAYVSTVSPNLDPDHWLEWQAPAGADGKPTEMRKTATHVQWRVEGAAAWNDLIPLTELKGNKGDDGKPVELQKTATEIQWRLQGETAWKTLYLLADVAGKDGRGLPPGGAKDQIPSKASATDYDIVWINPPTGGGGGNTMNLTGDQSASGTKTFTGRIVVGAAPGTGAPTIPANTGLVVYPPTVMDSPVTLTKRLDARQGTKNEQVLPITPAAGVATMTAYNAQQKVMLTADVAALTLKFPDASGNAEGNIYQIIEKGSVFKLFFPFAVASLTVTPGKNSYWWEDAKVLGAPASIAPGIYEVQFMGDELWYFSRRDGKVVVVDSGSSANGYWRKYSDGMMEQAFYAAANTAVSPAAPRANLTWTFPQPFVAGPGFTLPVVTFSGAARLAGTIKPCTKAEYGQTLTTAVCAVQTVDAGNLDDVRDVAWTAKGWWRAPPTT